MKVSKSYRLFEFLDWTRRKLYGVLALAIIPVVLYQLLGPEMDCIALVGGRAARYGHLVHRRLQERPNL